MAHVELGVSGVEDKSSDPFANLGMADTLIQINETLEPARPHKKHFNGTATAEVVNERVMAEPVNESMAANASQKDSRHTVAIEPSSLIARHSKEVPIVEESGLRRFPSNVQRDVALLGVGVALSIVFCLFAFCCRMTMTKDGLSATCVMKTVNGRNQFIFKGRLIYEWEQDATCVTMYITPPATLTKESIEVRVWPRHIKLGKKGKPPFLKDELYGSIDVDASTWSFSSNGDLKISLRKVEPTDWPCVLLLHRPKDCDSRPVNREKTPSNAVLITAKPREPIPVRFI
jgi:hypothetical protein